MAVPPQQFTVPPMAIGEIVENLRVYDIWTSKEQIIRPTTDFVEMVYYTCLKKVTNIDADTVRVPALEALDNLDEVNADLYSNAVTENLLHYHLDHLFQAVGIVDFTTMDLSAPDPARTREMITRLINYLRFMEEWAEPYLKEVRDHSSGLVKEHDSMRAKLAEMEAREAKLLKERERDAPKLAELSAEEKRLNGLMKKIKAQQTEKVSVIENLRLQRVAHSDASVKLNSRIMGLNEAINDLRSRIVQSPERIKSTIEEMRGKATEKKRMLGELEVRTRELQARVNAFLAIEKDVRGAIEQLETIEKEVQSLDASQKALAALTDQQGNKQIERKQLQNKHERVQSQLVNGQDKLVRAQQHWDAKRTEFKREAERLEEEYEIMAVERKENDVHVEEIRLEVEAVEAQMADHLKKGEAELQALLNEFHKLRYATDVYMETLARKLKVEVRVSKDTDHA